MHPCLQLIVLTMYVAVYYPQAYSIMLYILEGYLFNNRLNFSEGYF